MCPIRNGCDWQIYWTMGELHDTAKIPVGWVQDFPKDGGAPTYYLAKFSQKLYEKEENSTERGTRIQNFTM